MAPFSRPWRLPESGRNFPAGLPSTTMKDKVNASSVQRPDDPDAELVARCRDGDREAFAELVREHQMAVYNIAHRMAGNADDAEDLAQAAFLKAYSALRNFRGECSFRTWVCQIVTRLCLDSIRARRRAPLLLERIDYGTNPDWREAMVDKQVLDEAVAALPPAYRAAIVLRHCEELSYQEIAEALRLPIGTVKTHISRARALLAKRLAGSFGRNPQKA